MTMDRYVIALNIPGHPVVPDDADAVYNLADWLENQLETGHAQIMGVDIAHDLPDNLCEPTSNNIEQHTIVEVYHYIPEDQLGNEQLASYLKNALKECEAHLEYDYTCGDESQIRVIGLSLVLPLDTTSMDDYDEIVIKLGKDAHNNNDSTKNDNPI